MRFLSFAIIFLLSTAMAHNVAAEMADLPDVKIQALDKSTARTTTIKAKVGSTIKYGSLFIKVQACRKSDPLDKPENAAFIQIWEVPVGKKKSEWAFSGWMFSSSPALSAMDHVVYDVWILECLGAEKASEGLEKSNDDEAKDQKEIDLQDKDPKGENSSEAESIDSKPATTRIQAEGFDNVINGLIE